MSLLSPTVTDRLHELQLEFARAQPFRHLVLDQFLDPLFCQRLVAEFPTFCRQRARNELGEVGRKSTQENVRDLGDAYATLDSFIKSRDFLGTIERISGIPELHYDPDYVGGGTHENRSGQGLDPHVDFNYHPVTREHRRLNLILYLNAEWQPHWGGSIQFHSDPWNPDVDAIQTVLPLFNRCVLFETNEHSWHGFAPITPSADGADRSRKSFAIYLYSKTRPAAEIVAPHGTFYVHAPLPAHLTPGATLSEADYQWLRGLLAGRNVWMRHLYAKEIEYRGEILRLEQRLYGRSLGWLRRVGKVVAPLGTSRRRLVDRLIGKGR
jgi:hypothetical protein